MWSTGERQHTNDPTFSHGAVSGARRATARQEPIVHVMLAAVSADAAVVCLLTLDKLPRKSVAEHFDRPILDTYSNWLP
jgi:hypothetical protein